MQLLEELRRIFLGEEDTANLLFFAEIVFRTVVMYLYTIFLARTVGAGSVGQIGPFEFILVIAVGSAAGDPMFYPDVGLLQGILVITVVIVMHRAMGFVFKRSRHLERRIEGGPILVVRDGVIQDDALGSGSLTRRELEALLRAERVCDTGEVRRAYFEPNGRLSVFRFPEGIEVQGESLMPDD